MNKSDKIIKWLRIKLRNSKAKGFIVGLSGGIDSSVAAVLSKKACKNTIGIIMPCLSNKDDERLAKKLANKFHIETIIVKLDAIYSLLQKTLSNKINKNTPKIPNANIKPRLRMITLYYFANTVNYLVVGTGNKSELMMGYFTKYGDGGVDLLPLGSLFKTDVRKIAVNLRIPEEIINRPPSAGLWEGQSDESEMGITYKELDKTLKAIETKKYKDISTKTLKKVRKVIKTTEHKRTLPAIFNI